ncbi:MAG: glycosyltransferase family 2 protein [Nannocystaceae bacterium]|nr:glycosyltransferase family 2 protein [Nannocystaceae bacterium]
MLFVNDGCTDGSAEKLDALAAEDPEHVRVIHFRKNFGKSPALAAAFERVRGQIVLTLDADLQDDPAMIPKFVARIEAGADLVSGWKQKRHDPFGKTFPSKFFNWMTRRISGVELRDFNCGYKAYRIECIRELNVYGGFHRFLPVLAGERGFSIEELVVQHRAREHGVSKFGVSRIFHGFVDMLTILMLTRFRTKPAHLFGFLATVAGSVGGAMLVYLSVLRMMGEAIGTRPLLTLGVLLMIGAIQFVGLGLVAELLVRTTIRNKEIFSIRGTRGFPASESLAAATPTPPATQALPAAEDNGSATAQAAVPAKAQTGAPSPVGQSAR